jgi:hypothetical protein
MNFLGMYRRFGVVPQGFLLSLPFSLFGDFQRVFCDFHDWVLREISCGILVGCHLWGPCAFLLGDFAPATSFNQPRFVDFRSSSSS